MTKGWIDAEGTRFIRVLTATEGKEVILISYPGEPHLEEGRFLTASSLEEAAYILPLVKGEIPEDDTALREWRRMAVTRLRWVTMDRISVDEAEAIAQSAFFVGRATFEEGTWRSTSSTQVCTWGKFQRAETLSGRSLNLCKIEGVDPANPLYQEGTDFTANLGCEGSREFAAEVIGGLLQLGLKPKLEDIEGHNTPLIPWAQAQGLPIPPLPPLEAE